MHNQEIRDAYMLLTKAGFTVQPPRQEGGELKPMVTDDKINLPEYYKVRIEFANTNHFQRTLKFVRENGLEAEFAKSFVDLIGLLLSSRGSKVVHNAPEADRQLVGFNKKEDGSNDHFNPIYEAVPLCRVYPDGYTDPGFGWNGCGMVGGLIFHRSTKDWSIHT